MIFRKNIIFGGDICNTLTIYHSTRPENKHPGEEVSIREEATSYH